MMAVCACLTCFDSEVLGGFKSHVIRQKPVLYPELLIIYMLKGFCHGSFNGSEKSMP